MGGHPEQQRGRGLWFTGRKRAGNQDAPGGQRPSRGRQARMATIAGCGAAAIALVVGACGSSGSSSSSGGTKEAGGVATYALPPSTTPNYIFPMSNSTYFSVSNFSYLQFYLYRPLYWFGNGTQPTLNPSLSLADQPVYNGKQVTITLKNYKWSDGTPVTAQNVLFWIHMLQAVGQTEWGDFTPGGFPTNVTDVKATSDTTLTMTMNKTVLADLVHLQPAEPDPPDAEGLEPDGVTARATAPPPCRTTRPSTPTSTASPRPCRPTPALAGYGAWWTAVETAGLQRGRQRHVRAEQVLLRTGQADAGAVQGVPFTTEAAEYNVLRSGSGSKLSVGYLPTTDAPKKAGPGSARTRCGVRPQPAYGRPSSLSGANIDSTTPEGQVIKQPLPAGAGLPGEAGGGHRRPAARLTTTNGPVAPTR